MGTIFNTRKKQSTGVKVAVSVATIIGTILAGCGLAAGGVVLIALIFAFGVVVNASLIWLANFALAKAFAVMMLTFKQDLCIGAVLQLVKAIFTSGSRS